MIATTEEYLDRLFDTLSGSGARGRRVLLEAQAHLEEAVERAVAAGASWEAAERMALARFGSVEEVARAHNVAAVLPARLALIRVFAAGWLMTGVCGVCVALVGILNGIVGRVAPQLIVADPADVRPFAVGAIALVLLALFAIARATPSLRALTHLPSGAMVSTAGAVGFGGVGLVLLAYGALGFAVGEPAEFAEHLTQGLAGVAAGLMFVPHAWREVTLDRV